SVLVESIEAASLLPGFKATQDRPVKLVDDNTEASGAPSVVFISYRREDVAIAERLASALAQHGLDSCSFEHVLSPGLPMPERIDEMIRSSLAVLVIHSDRELGANVGAEVGIARANNKPIIAIRTGKVDPSASLDFANAYIDASANWDAAINDVLRAIGVPRRLASVSSERTKKPRNRRPPKSVEQRPAAYRFTTAGDKIDVLPELPEPLDRQLAADTQKELSEKARNLLIRLQGTNSAQRVCESVQRLLDALGVPFDQLRPGVLLSRVRSLEADGAAFDTEDARAELFPDAFARVADTVQTARDLLGLFPKVRQIEVERVALDLHRLPDALPAIEQRAHEIEEAAQKSGAVTPDAVRALAKNDAAIDAAANLVLRGSLVADKLLVVGNFARAVAGTGWARGLSVGLGMALTAAPLMALAYSMAGPVGALAVIPLSDRSLVYSRKWSETTAKQRQRKTRLGQTRFSGPETPRRGTTGERPKSLHCPRLPLKPSFSSKPRKHRNGLISTFCISSPALPLALGKLRNGVN
ncbi:MAG: toll/interleukin-1 receptor domain-containing protein, partial [Stellaceae bacterium]